MIENELTLKEVCLNNNCPICYSKKGLRLTFKQKTVETTFYKSITAEITNEMECNTCNSIIYPVQWTDSLERVFEYQRKLVVSKKASTYLKKASWIVIGACIIIVLTVGFLLAIYPEL